jgi:hypothetical protein
VVSRLERRTACDLYHSVIVRVPQGRFVIEQAPVRCGDGSLRGVVSEGAVGSRWARRFRIFRYELRCWPDGVIPDADEAVESPQRLTDDPRLAQRILDLVSSVPTPVWGRDELHAGEMWNSTVADPELPVDRRVIDQLMLAGSMKTLPTISVEAQPTSLPRTSPQTIPSRPMPESASDLAGGSLLRSTHTDDGCEWPQPRCGRALGGTRFDVGGGAGRDRCRRRLLDHPDPRRWTRESRSCRGAPIGNARSKCFRERANRNDSTRGSAALLISGLSRPMRVKTAFRAAGRGCSPNPRRAAPAAVR